MKWELKVSMFSKALTGIELDTPADEPYHTFWCRVKTIAVVSGQLRPLFWEDLVVDHAGRACSLPGE